jgi:hypothetical protein
VNRPRFKIICVVLAALAVVIGALFFFTKRSQDSGVLASLRLPDGSEYAVTQELNEGEHPFSLDYIRYGGSIIWGKGWTRWTAAPYRVSFFMRSAGGQWGWCYIDHKAHRWGDVSMTYDPATDVITITERGDWRAALDRKRSAFSIGPGKPAREVAAPQSLFWATGFSL